MILGDYKLIKLLARGGFRKVVLAKRKLAGGPGSNQQIFAV